MRETLLPLGVFAAMLGGPPAHAQSAAPLLPPTDTPAPHDTARPTVKKPVPPHVAKPVMPVATPPKVPVAPPPAPVLPPPLVVPLRPMPPPPQAAVVADATGDAVRTKDGLRVTFGPGSSDLNPATDSALRALVRDAPPFATVTYTVVAVAPGVAEDPSTPRRLSLSRALAVRSVLITEGIPSNRIYVKAMGASPLAIAGGPPDRADVALGGTTPVSQPAPGSQPVPQGAGGKVP